MPSITLRHLDFNYDSPYADVFRDLNLLIDCGWRTGLVGRNGQGKTTLLQLIAGNVTAQAGEVDVPTRLRAFPTVVASGVTTREAIKDAIAPYREWERKMVSCLAINSDTALLEYAQLQEHYLEAGGYEVDAKIETELIQIGLPPDKLEQPFASLSGGEQTRALIVSLFVDKHAYPLIDEPTNHLDMNGREILTEYLARQRGFLMVSHDRGFLDGSVDHIVSLNRSDVRVNNGNFTQWRKHMDEELLHESRTRQNIEREVKQLKRAAQQRRQGAEARERDKHRNDPSKGGAAKKDTGYIGHRAAKQMKRALVVERRVDHQLAEKKTLLKNQEKERQLKITTQATGNDQLLTVQNVAFGYGDENLFTNFSLSISTGERVALLGPNGSGKTSLFNLVDGTLKPRAGMVYTPSYVQISRSFQQPIWSHGNLRPHLEANHLPETRFRQLMGIFGISGDIFERPLETFSQGQLKKVDLCRSMMEEAALLLWDEPLNFVDLYSREQIESAILANEPTMLFIEHDRIFVDRIATRVIEMT